ncbi:MAG: ABC transporter ATP-binding protein [Hungatella sp.]|jgi:putative ABC transport system ATP-binding protein|nr:ABC transporter ATP-binding protein [Hungatella sp.]
MGKSILKTVKLSKSYGIAQILNDINFNMNQGDYVAVMGPSGAGKSTFMHMISGMDRPTSGQVYIGENELAGMNDKETADLRLKKIGMVFQQPSLLPTLNLIDNIMLPAYLLHEEPAVIIYERAVKLLTLFGMADKEKASVNTLSGGQMQRGCIARALINNPSMLFADEPTGALNSSATNQILQVLKTVNNNGTAILMVTHDIKVAAKAKKIVYFFDGTIKEQFIFEKDIKQSDREKYIMDLIERF